MCDEIFCKECDACICDECGDDNCGCPTPVIEVKDITVSYTIKVVFHEWKGEPCDQEDHDNQYTDIEDAIKEYDFGYPRIGAHHWDQDACHVSQCPVTKKYILLYM